MQRDPQLRLAVISASDLVDGVHEQWNPTSPWHDRRVRLAATWPSTGRRSSRWSGWASQAGGLDYPPSLGVRPAPGTLPLRPGPSPAPAGGAGYPHGFEAGDLNPIPPFFTLGEAVGNYLRPRAFARRCTMERAAFLSAWREKKLKGSLSPGQGVRQRCHAHRRLWISTGVYAYGGHPDIDALFQQQALERDRSKREALLHQMQRLMQERVMHAPLAEPAALHGVGPRVEEPGRPDPAVCLLAPMRRCACRSREGRRCRPAPTQWRKGGARYNLPSSMQKEDVP